MGQEPVYFREKYFYENNYVVSRVQKFMEIYLSSFEHPEWFNEVLKSLSANFNIPLWKDFFDEEIIENDNEKFSYCVRMLNLTIGKMESINKKEFFNFINNEIKGTWCDLDVNSISDDFWLDENDSFHKHYIGTLLNLKKIMKD